MKKVLLVVLVALGLQTQAQITCDSITTTYLDITPTHIEVTTNSMNLGVQWPMHAWDLYAGTLSYYDTNTTAIIPLPSPNLVDTFVLCNWSDFGAAPWVCYSCDTFAWNGNNWDMVQQQTLPPTQNGNICDSIYIAYNTSFQTYPFEVYSWISDSSLISMGIDTVEFWWGVCTQDMCYSGTGWHASFPQITYQDTIKVCYDAHAIINNTIVTTCTSCDSLIWDGIQWVLFSMTNPTSIQELTSNKTNDGKIYDMLGREVNNIEIGTMYIRNNKKFIRTE